MAGNIVNINLDPLINDNKLNVALERMSSGLDKAFERAVRKFASKLTQAVQSVENKTLKIKEDS